MRLITNFIAASLLTGILALAPATSFARGGGGGGGGHFGGGGGGHFGGFHGGPGAGAWHHDGILGDFGPEAIAAKVGEGMNQGFTAVKFDPIPVMAGDMALAQLVHEVTERVAAAREAAGRNVDLILEFHRRFSWARAHRGFGPSGCGDSEFRGAGIFDDRRRSVGSRIHQQPPEGRRLSAAAGTARSRRVCRPPVGTISNMNQEFQTQRSLSSI